MIERSFAASKTRPNGNLSHQRVSLWRFGAFVMVQSQGVCHGQPMTQIARDQTLDGFRGLAALGVVIAHSINYRFLDVAMPGKIMFLRLAEPLAQTSVQLFFVISGFIITKLLLKEERARGRFSMQAFYLRRSCRIFPPIVAYFAALIALAWFNVIELDSASMITSAVFACNLGVVECQWWVGHTWSLAVEEQFYLLWPLILLLVPKRAPLLIGGLVVLLVGFLIAPLEWHSNYISFACISIGALCAVSTKLRSAIERSANIYLWFGAGLLLVVAPLYAPAKLMQLCVPFIIAYVIFSAGQLKVARSILSFGPLQIIAMASYSLYLWQQLFLAPPAFYNELLPFWLLPVAVFLSVVLVEKPFIAIGRRLSSAAMAKSEAKCRAPMPAANGDAT